MESGISFTGGSRRYIDRALELADREKQELFIANLVHCHPPKDRPSYQHEIDNRRWFLSDELDVVAPRLIIGLGSDAEKALLARYPEGQQLRGVHYAADARTRHDVSAIPRARRLTAVQETAARAYYSPSLARAIRWGYGNR